MLFKINICVTLKEKRDYSWRISIILSLAAYYDVFLPKSSRNIAHSPFLIIFICRLKRIINYIHIKTL